MSPSVTTSAAAPSRGLIEWTARLGAVTDEALAGREQITLAAARGRLVAAVRRGELSRTRPLAGRPSIYTVTRRGLRACPDLGVAPMRVGAGDAAHAIACAQVAAWLERAYPGRALLGEPQLRSLAGAGATSPRARPGAWGPGEAALGAWLRTLPLPHRPDLLVVSPGDPGDAVAIEVELTVKAPRRLAAICRSWARCRSVAGALYVASPTVERALLRALDAAAARGRVAVVALAAVEGSIADPIPIAT